MTQVECDNVLVLAKQINDLREQRAKLQTTLDKLGAEKSPARVVVGEWDQFHGRLDALHVTTEISAALHDRATVLLTQAIREIDQQLESLTLPPVAIPIAPAA